MNDYLNQLNKKINEIIVRIKKEILENKRIKYSSLLIRNVYYRDIIESFVINK